MSDDEKIDGLNEKAERARVSMKKAKEIMNSKIVTINHDAKIKSVISTLANHEVSGLPVVDNQKRLMGIVTQYDLLLQAATKDLEAPITYTQKVVTINEATHLKDIIALLYKTRHRRLPVVDKDGFLLGIVSRIDVLKYLADID